MEYNIGGKIFLKKGGKYIPKMGNGGGDYYTSTYGNLNPTKYVPPTETSTKPRSEHSPSVWNLGMDMVGNTFNSLANVPNPGTSARAIATSNSYNKDNTVNNVGSGILNTAAMLDPTGTAALINGAMNMTKGISKFINPGDEYGVAKNNVAEAAGSILDPLGWAQQSVNIGKKHGFKEGVKNFLTFGVSGNNLMRDDVSAAKVRDKEDDMRMRQGMNQGAYRNDSVYAQMGARITPKNSRNLEQNVEIEDGEIVLGDPTRMGIQGNTSTSLESKYGALFHGDKHGFDSDKDGKEGIPLSSGEAYVASNYLGLDGKRAVNGNKSVASEMKPYLKFLNGGEANPTNPYKNNPVAIAETNRQLGLLKKEAERNKFMEELGKQARSKDRNVNDILSFITQNAPMEDMTPEEQSQVEQLNNQLSNNQNQNQIMNYNNGMRFGGHYFQQGGMTQPEQNPSQDRMSQLIEQTPQLDPSQQGAEGQAQAQGGQMSPEAQQIMSQLPPEVQQQIMQLPPEQREQAIMQYAQQMQGQAQQGAPEGAQQEMPGTAMPGAEMTETPQVGMEQGQPVMKCGGRMYRKGDYVRFQRGGRVTEGYIANINPNSNTFSLR